MFVWGGIFSLIWEKLAGENVREAEIRDRRLSDEAAWTAPQIRVRM